MKYPTVQIDEIAELRKVFRQVGFHTIEVIPTLMLNDEDRVLRIYVSMDKFHKIKNYFEKARNEVAKND